MENKDNKTENEVELNSRGDEIVRNEKGQIQKGYALNPNGRPKGAKNFYTDFKEAIKRISDKETGEELTEIHIIKIGLEKMLEGDSRFEGLYKDLLDRVYGKPTQTTELTGKDGKDLIPNQLTDEEKEALMKLVSDE